MNIETKFNLGERAYYYHPQMKLYCWGKVEHISVNIPKGKPPITRYTIHDNFTALEREYNWRQSYYGHSEGELFKSVAEVMEYLRKKE